MQSLNTEYVPDGGNQTSEVDLGWSSKAEYSYTPDRRLQLSFAGSVRGVSGEKENNKSWLCSEKLEYRFYKSNGIVRKIAEVSEEFGGEGTNDKTSDRNRTLFLRVAAAIFPTKYLYAKVTSEFLLFNPADSEQTELNAETGANFQKMQVALSYGRGYKAAEGPLAEVKEERWDMRERKLF